MEETKTRVRKRRTKLGEGHMPENIDAELDKLSDEQLLTIVNVLLEIKELELPICLMVNRITKTLLTDEETKVVDGDMLTFIREFHEKMFKVEDSSINPVAVMDGLAYLMLSLHVYIMEHSKEYKLYSDKLRNTVLDGSYIGKDDFNDPSIR